MQMQLLRLYCRKEADFARMMMEESLSDSSDESQMNVIVIMM